MKINIKTTGISLTPALRIYIQDKLGTLSKFVKRFEAGGQPEMWLEIARITKHHYKGPVFRAEADLRLPKKILRAEHREENVRAAIDLLRNKLRLEIEKYKTKENLKGNR
jgi:ribosomal subunit interface protein